MNTVTKINTDLADATILALKAQGYSKRDILDYIESRFDEQVAMIAFKQNGGK